MTNNNFINNDDKLFKKTIFVTGGAGFIGSHIVVALVEKNDNVLVINYDKLDYCSSLKNLQSIANRKNYIFIKGDICDESLLRDVFTKHPVSEVIHCAALTHVDRSFADPLSFWHTNVTGTQLLLRTVAAYCCPRLRRFLYLGTDEVYGCHGYGKHKVKYNEKSAVNPTNPYSKSKLAAEQVVLSYLDRFAVVIVRLNNVYGPRQYPEKVIPRFITLLKDNQHCCIHGEGSVRRHFLFVSDAVSAILTALVRGTAGSTYNVAGDHCLAVKQLAAELVLRVKGHTECEKYIYYVMDRLHNDRGYSLSSKRIHKLGWKAKVSWKKGISETVKWYMENDTRDIWSTLSDAYNPHY